MLDTKYNHKLVEEGKYENWKNKGYFESGDTTLKPYAIVIPPPNVTGKLHLGHAWDTTLQDIMIRYKKMDGYDAMWLPGMDHAAIATEAKVVQRLKSKDINKYELYDVKSKLLELTETDYTEKSWGDLQDAITKAENAMTNAEYDEVKSMLTINNLEVEKFEKTELNSLLVALIGKAENKYTEESWKELQDAIDLANKAELQSEYDEIKDKLTIDTLVEKEGGFQGIVNFFQGLDEQERISLALGVCVAILFIIIIILWRLYSKEKDRMRYDARRH